MATEEKQLLEEKSLEVGKVKTPLVDALQRYFKLPLEPKAA